MKELSIEEKAKAYDEAKIKGSRLWECGEITRENYEYIFSELKESEDERIRKAIIEFFELQDDNTTYSFVPKKDIIAWLEKQGEQKPAEWSDDFEEEMDRYIEENFYGSAGCGFFSNRTKRELEAEDVVRIGCYFATWQKEQLLKSFNKQKQEWSEEDKNMLQSILDEYKSMPTEKRNWLKSLSPRSHWKPSEEQIQAVEEALSLAKNCGEEYSFDLRKLLEQLKAL